MTVRSLGVRWANPYPISVCCATGAPDAATVTIPIMVLPPLIGNTAECPAGMRVTVVSVIETTISNEGPPSTRRAVTRTEGEGALISRCPCEFGWCRRCSPAQCRKLSP
jgi:hypothetical protein